MKQGSGSSGRIVCKTAYLTLEASEGTTSSSSVGSVDGVVRRWLISHAGQPGGDSLARMLTFVSWTRCESGPRHKLGTRCTRNMHQGRCAYGANQAKSDPQEWLERLERGRPLRPRPLRLCYLNGRCRLSKNKVMLHCQSVCLCRVSVVGRGRRLQFPSFPLHHKMGRQCIVYQYRQVTHRQWEIATCIKSRQIDHGSASRCAERTGGFVLHNATSAQMSVIRPAYNDKTKS